MKRTLAILVLVPACGGGSGSSAPDGAVSTPDAATTPTWSLDDPAPGEWPTFHRRNRRDGVVADETGAITAANVCARFAYPATVAGTRANSGMLIANVGGTPMALGVVESCPTGEASCVRDGVTYSGGFVFGVDGSGREVFRTQLPDEAQSDVYAPTLADLDGDGKRELVMASNDRPYVYAIRTEDEPGGAAGTVKWRFDYSGDLPMGQSEGAPAVAQLDDDPALEVVIGTDANQAGVRAKVYVLDGATGQPQDTPFTADDRAVADPDCTSINKIDSSSPAIATVDGEPRLFVGAWDGTFRALAVRDGALVPAWTYALPDLYGFPCGVAKVRSGAVIADVVPGGNPEVAFGMMGEGPSGDVFTASNLRVLDAATGELEGEVDVPDWKSSPAAADVTGDGTPDLLGGHYRGYYAASWTGAGFATTAPGWDVDWSDGLPYGANRSSPAIADIDGDGKLDMIVGTESSLTSGDGRRGLTVLDAATGAVEWTWPPDGVTTRPNVASSPAVGDIDGDGQLEIVFLGDDGVVYALDSSCP